MNCKYCEDSNKVSYQFACDDIKESLCPFCNPDNQHAQRLYKIWIDHKNNDWD